MMETFVGNTTCNKLKNVEKKTKFYLPEKVTFLVIVLLLLTKCFLNLNMFGSRIRNKSVGPYLELV